MMLDTNPTRPIPRAQWTTNLVCKAYEDALSRRAALKILRRIGAIIDAPKARPRKVDPDVIRDRIPIIFHRCVELVIERRLKASMDKDIFMIEVTK